MYDIDKLIIQEYSGQNGYGTLPYFVGKQYGTGWLRNIARMAFPFLKKALNVVGNVAVNTAGDLINDENKKFVPTVMEHATSAVKNVMKRKNCSESTINGSGLAKRRRAPTHQIII